MPEFHEIKHDVLTRGRASQYYEPLEADAQEAATTALEAWYGFHGEGPNPEQASGELAEIAYHDFLNKAREARGLPAANRTRYVAQLSAPEGQEIAQGPGGSLVKGVQAGRLRLRGMLEAMTGGSEDDVQAILGSADQRQEAIAPGLLNKIAAITGSTGTELVPQIAASFIPGGAALTGARLAASLGTRGAAVTSRLTAPLSKLGLPAAAGVGGVQSAVPEYYDRRAEGRGEEESLKLAGAKGLSTAAFTMLFGKTGVEALADPMRKAALRTGIVRALVSGGVKEGAEEMADEAVASFIDVAGANDKLTFGEFAERMGWAGGMGAMFGSGMEAVANATKPKRPPAAPAAPAPGAAPVAPAAPAAPVAAAPKTAPKVTWRRLLNGERDVSQLAPQEAALLAAEMEHTFRNDSKALPEPTRAMIEKLFVRGGVDVPEKFRVPVQASTEPVPAPEAAAPVAPATPVAAAAPVAAAPAAPVAPKTKGKKSKAAVIAAPGAAASVAPAAPGAPVAPPSPAAAIPAVAPQEGTSDALRGQESNQETSQGQSEEGLRPVRQEGDEEVDAVLKTGGLGAERVLARSSAGPRLPVSELEARLADLDAERDAAIAERAKPVKARITRVPKRDRRHRAVVQKQIDREVEVITTQEARETETKKEAAYVEFLSRLTPEQSARVRKELPSLKNLNPTALKKLRDADIDESLARTRSLNPEPRPVGDRVRATGEPALNAEPGPVNTQAADVDRRDPGTSTGKPQKQPRFTKRMAKDRDQTVQAGDDLQARAKKARQNPDVQQETDLPEGESRESAFGISMDPESPAYPGEVRRRVIEEINRKRQDILGVQTKDLDIKQMFSADPLYQAARKVVGERGPNSNIAAAREAMAKELRKRPAAAAPVKIRTGFGEFKEALLYEAPNSVGKLAEEYVALVHKGKAYVKHEAKILALRGEIRGYTGSETDTKQAAKDYPRELLERHREGIITKREYLELLELHKKSHTPSGELNAADLLSLRVSRKKLEDELDQAQKTLTRSRLSKADRQRMHDLSAALRGLMAESIGTRIAAYLTATPGSDRRTVSKRFQDAIQRGLIGMEQDLAAITQQDVLLDPKKLSEAHRRQYIAEFIDEPGTFALVVPSEHGRDGKYDAVNAHGDPVRRYPSSEGEKPSGEAQTPGRRVILGRSMGDLRAAADVDGLVTPFITKNLDDIIDLTVNENLMPASGELSRTDLARMMQNGFGVDMAGKHHETGQVPEAALPPRLRQPTKGHPGKQTDEDLEVQHGETIDTYLDRLLLTKLNSPIGPDGQWLGKSVDAAKLREAVKVFPGGPTTLREWLETKYIVQKGSTILTGTPSEEEGKFRLYSKTPSGATRGPDSGNYELLSDQRLVEHAATLFDVTVFVGARGGVSLPPKKEAKFDPQTRTMLLRHHDPLAFAHEFGHDLLERHLANAPVGVATELKVVASAGGQVPHPSEGAAELLRAWVQDPEKTARLYPTATDWMEPIFASAGILNRMKDFSGLVRRNQAATPQERVAAKQMSHDQREDRTDEQGTSYPPAGPVATALSKATAVVTGRPIPVNQFAGWGARAFWRVRGWFTDRNKVLDVVHHRALKTVKMTDMMYEAKMMQSARASTAGDGYTNGHVINEATQERTYGFDQFQRDVEVGLELNSTQLVEAMNLIWAKAILERNPRLRRKLFREAGLNDEDYGPWGMSLEVLEDRYVTDREGNQKLVRGDPGRTQTGFDSKEEIIETNRLITEEWEQLVKDRKAQGKLPPPEPELYPVTDPSPGARGNDAAITNISEKDAADAIAIVKNFKKDHEYGHVAVLWKKFVDGLDDWKFEHGQLTAGDREMHREVLYYVPMKTDVEHSQGGVEARGTGGADTFKPFQAMLEKTHVAYRRWAQEEPKRALARSGLIATARKRDGSDEEKLDADAYLKDVFGATSFDQFDDAAMQKLEAVSQGGQASSVSDEMMLVKIDEPTLEAMLEAGVVPSSMLHNPEQLLGRTYAFRVKDPMIRDGLEANFPGAGNLFERAAAMPADVVRKMYTTFSPTFWYKTLTRDTVSAFIQSMGGNPATFLASDLKGAQDAWHAAGKLANDRVHTDKMYSAFVSSGIPRSSVLADQHKVENVLTESDLRQTLNTIGDNNPGSLLAWWKKAAGPAERFSNTIEGFNRAGEQRRVVALELAKRGVTDLNQLHKRDAREVLMIANRSAQEIGVNFNRGGSVTLALDRYVPFLNPTIQGTVKGFKTLTAQKIHNADTGKNAAMRAARGWLVLGSISLIQHWLLSDDDGEALEDYKEKSDAERGAFWHFKIGNYPGGQTQFAKIPKPQGPYISALGMMEKIMADNPMEWREVAIGSLKENVAKIPFVPTALSLIIETFTGKRFGGPSWAGIPEYKQGTDASSLTAPHVSDSSWAVSEALTSMGLPGMSPLKVDNLFNGYTGGLGTLVTDAPMWWKQAAGTNPASTEVGDLPVIRAMLSQHPSMSTRSVTKAYALMETLSGWEDSANAEIKQASMNMKTVGEAVQKIKKDRPEFAFGLGTKQAVTEFRQDLSKLRVLMQRIDTDQSKTLVQRRVERDRWVERITDAAKRFTDKVTSKAASRGINTDQPWWQVLAN